MRKALGSVLLVCGGLLSVNAVAQTLVTTLGVSTGSNSISVDSNNVYYFANPYPSGSGNASLYSAPRTGGASIWVYNDPAGLPYMHGSAEIGSNIYFQNANAGPSTGTEIFVAPSAGGGPVSGFYTAGS